MISCWFKKNSDWRPSCLFMSANREPCMIGSLVLSVWYSFLAMPESESVVSDASSDARWDEDPTHRQLVKKTCSVAVRALGRGSFLLMLIMLWLVIRAHSLLLLPVSSLPLLLESRKSCGGFEWYAAKVWFRLKLFVVHADSDSIVLLVTFTSVS